MTSPINEQVAKLQGSLAAKVDQAFLTWLGAADVQDAEKIVKDLAEVGVRPAIEYGSPRPVNTTPGDGTTYALETTVRFRYVPIEPTA